MGKFRLLDFVSAAEMSMSHLQSKLCLPQAWLLVFVAVYWDWGRHLQHPAATPTAADLDAPVWSYKMQN